MFVNRWEQVGRDSSDGQFGMARLGDSGGRCYTTLWALHTAEDQLPSGRWPGPHAGTQVHNYTQGR